MCCHGRERRPPGKKSSANSSAFPRYLLILRRVPDTILGVIGSPIMQGQWHHLLDGFHSAGPVDALGGGAGESCAGVGGRLRFVDYEDEDFAMLKFPADMSSVHRLRDRSGDSAA